MIQRGITVFNSLLFDDIEELPRREHRGRSPELLDARDRLLLHRFYFKTRIQGKQYPTVLKELEKELFISVMQIQKIIQSKLTEILHIKKQQPSIQWLRKEWEFMNWAS